MQPPFIGAQGTFGIAKPSASSAGGGSNEVSYGDYHQLVATMQSEIKAQPSDRLQSDAECAAAEQKRLR